MLHISFRKLDDDRHELAVRRDGGALERVECETRSYLMHDLLHYAVESEAGLAGGFWGSLASGVTLAEMNDRSRPHPPAADLPAIERLVGALHAATKDGESEEIMRGMERYASALGEPLPAWLDVALVARVIERMRRLKGAWRATGRGDALELAWPAQ